MRRSTLISTTAALALTGGAVVVAAGSTAATAGHSNTVAEASLDGRSEVRTDARDNRISGDPNGAGEAYVFGIDEAGGARTTLCYVLEVEGIADLALAPGAPRAAHIHEGAAGENGPVVANLAWPQGGDAADCLTQDEVLPSGAKAFPTGEAIADILADPARYYVNVHNGEYPAGAVRGQLSDD